MREFFFSWEFVLGTAILLFVLWHATTRRA